MSEITLFIVAVDQCIFQFFKIIPIAQSYLLVVNEYLEIAGNDGGNGGLPAAVNIYQVMR